MIDDAMGFILVLALIWLLVEITERAPVVGGSLIFVIFAVAIVLDLLLRKA